MQAGLGLLIVELLIPFGTKALGVSNWVGPSLLLMLAFFGMRYLFTANLRAGAFIGAATIVLFADRYLSKMVRVHPPCIQTTISV